MGTTHLDAYSKLSDAEVIAVSDLLQERREGKQNVGGNIEGQAKGGFDFAPLRKYDEGMKLIADPDIDVVDICIWTHLHVQYAIAALEAGKHVLVEKPLGRTHAEAMKLVEASKKAKGLTMCAQCMRFWPGWTWLKETMDSGKYGKVLGAQFRRVAGPTYGDFYSNGELCGGAILDLHIHDTDFVQWLFGTPKAVATRGYARHTGAPDHVLTQYVFDDVPLVAAEGGWAMSEGFGFSMQYSVNFEGATASFMRNADTPMEVVTPSGKVEIDLKPGMGYQYEIEYFIDCVKNGRAPETVTLATAAESVRIVEAEVESLRTGKTVSL